MEKTSNIPQLYRAEGNRLQLQFNPDFYEIDTEITECNRSVYIKVPRRLI